MPRSAVAAALVALALAGPGDAWPARQGVEATPNQGASDFHYQSIAIAQPKTDSTVFDNSGNLRVDVDVSPALRAASGDRIAVLLDGAAAWRSANAEIVLNGIARSTHSLQAEVVNIGGSVLLASPIVTFHLWQASKLFPSRSR